MDKVVTMQAKAELNTMKLERLGRRMIEGRIYERRQAAFNRSIVRCVHDHLHASASELQDRLNELFARRDMPIDEAEIQFEISRLKL